MQNDPMRILPDRRQRRERIEAFREYTRTWCVSDFRMRRTIMKRTGPAPFARIRFRVGTVVHSGFRSHGNELWLVVGHGYTGPHGKGRGCMACRILRSGTIAKRWEWIGPESRIRKATPAKE